MPQPWIEFLDKVSKFGLLKIAKPGEEIFRLASGARSMFLFDLQRESGGKLLPDDFIKCVAELLRDEIVQRGLAGTFSLVAGVPNGGTRYAQALATLLDVPCLSVTKSVNCDGYTVFNCNQHATAGVVLLIEDVITTANTARAAREAIAKQGHSVTDLLSVFDRGQRQHDIRNPRVHSVLTAHAYFYYLWQNKRLDIETYGRLLRELYR